MKSKKIHRNPCIACNGEGFIRQNSCLRCKGKGIDPWKPSELEKRMQGPSDYSSLSKTENELAQIREWWSKFNQRLKPIPLQQENTKILSNLLLCRKCGGDGGPKGNCSSCGGSGWTNEFT
jgi:DnaJ-class molecular chaperone